MAARKKAAPKAEEDRTVEEPTTDEVYAGYEPAPVPDRVEVRINGRIVFLHSARRACRGAGQRGQGAWQQRGTQESQECS